MSNRANHTGDRLSDAAIAARREYRRTWNKKHPDKLRQYNRTFWERKGAEFAATRAAQRKKEETENA